MKNIHESEKIVPRNFDMKKDGWFKFIEVTSDPYLSWETLFGKGTDVPDPRGKIIDIDYEEVNEYTGDPVKLIKQLQSPHLLPNP